MASTHAIAVIMNVNKDFDRRIVAGIARYAQEVGNWSVYLEDEMLDKMPDLRAWDGDGIIADLDDPLVERAVAGVKIPVVGVGGFAWPSLLKANVPYVATDNWAIGRLGAEHLLGCGFESFAYFGTPRTRYHSWSAQRGLAFADRLKSAGFTCRSYVGRHRTARRWNALQERLVGWLKTLPRPVAIMACDDPRARHVVEACRQAKLGVPDDVAILGVDNDPMMCEMSVPTLSSIEQNAEAIGYTAATALRRMLGRNKEVKRWATVPPLRVVTRRSTDVIASKDCVVVGALRYIRERRSKVLQVTDVAEYVAVSRTTLDRHFQKAIGRSVHDELERVRLETAKHLLATTDLPIKSVAHQSGFRSVNYLGFVLRRDSGISPGRYRRQAKGSVPDSMGGR